MPLLSDLVDKCNAASAIRNASRARFTRDLDKSPRVTLDGRAFALDLDKLVSVSTLDALVVSLVEVPPDAPPR